MVFKLIELFVSFVFNIILEKQFKILFCKQGVISKVNNSNIFNNWSRNFNNGSLVFKSFS